MACYVGPLTPARKSKKWRWSHSAYLLADTTAELHEMAELIGMVENWCHHGSHYDLTYGMRLKAIRNGATELRTLRDVGKKSLEIREAKKETAS